MDEKRYNEQRDLISTLGIYDLRNLARKYSVSSPTTKKRAELIESIMKRIKEGKEAGGTVSRQGRPAKVLAGSDKLFEKINSIGKMSESFLVFAQEVAPFEEKRIIPFKPVKIDSKTFCNEGGNYLTEYTDISSVIKKSTTVLNHLNKQGYKTMLIALNLPYEEKLYTDQNLNAEKFITVYENSAEEGFNKLIAATNQMEKLEKEGNKVFAVILDVVGVLNILDLYFASSEETNIFGRFEKSIIVLKKLMSMAKARKEERSITLITSVYQSDVSDPVFINEVKKICKNLE